MDAVVLTSAVFFLLSLLVILGKFADFLSHAKLPETTSSVIVPSGHTAGAAEQYQPKEHIQLALQRTDGFFRYIFKGEFIEGTGFLHCFLISAFFVQGTLIFSALFKLDETWNLGAAPHFPAVWIVLTLLGLVFANFLADIISVAFTRGLLKVFLGGTAGGDGESSIAAKRWARILAYVFPAVILVYGIILVTTINTSYSIIVTARGFASGYFIENPSDWLDMQQHIIQHETFWRFVDPFGEGQHLGISGINIVYFCVTPLLPPLLVALAASGGLFLDAADRLTAGKLTSWLGLLSSHERPVFLVVASVVALIGSAAAAILSVFGTS